MDVIVFPPFQRLHVEGRKRFKYITFGLVFLENGEKISVLKISGYVWTAPKLELLFQIQLENQFSKTMCCV